MYVIKDTVQKMFWDGRDWVEDKLDAKHYGHRSHALDDLPDVREEYPEAVLTLEETE